MTIYILIIWSSKTTKEQLAVTETKSIVLKEYNKTIIQQLGICDVAIMKNKEKLCRCFVMPGNGQAVRHARQKNSICTNSNTIDMETNNEHIYCKTKDRGPFTSTQETGNLDNCSLNKTGIANSNNGDKPMVIVNINIKITYFIPGSSQEADKKGKCRNYAPIIKKVIRCIDGD